MARSPAQRAADAVAHAQVDLLVMSEIFEALAVAADGDRGVEIHGSWMRWFGRHIADVADAIDVASMPPSATRSVEVGA